MAVQELGIEPAKVRVLVDTSRELGAGQTTGSRGTLMGAGAVAAACKAACDDGCRPGVDYEGEYRVDWTQAIGTVDRPTIHSTFGYAAQLVVMDRESGDIERVVAAHDVGRAVNPLLCEGQVISVVLPDHMIFKVVETTPWVKGSTAAGGNKPATLDTGAVIQVPVYLGQDEWVRVDTRTDKFVDRAKGPEG